MMISILLLSQYPILSLCILHSLDIQKCTLALANLPPSGPSGIPTIHRQASSASAYGGRIRKHSNMSNIADEPGKVIYWPRQAFTNRHIIITLIKM